jgi:hypothetical protein
VSLLHFLILALATWRITSLLVDEPGPKDILSKIRNKLGVKFNEQNERYAINIIGEYLNCVWCMSYVVGGIVVLFYLFAPWSIYLFSAFAFSAVSMLCDKQLWRGYRKGH